MKKSKISKTFKDRRVPFVESRYIVNSNTHYKEHFHDTLSIGAIEDGQVSFTYNNITSLLNPNSLVVISKDVLHSCNPIKNEARTYHMIYLDTLWCKGIQENIFGKLDKFIEVSDVIINDKYLFDELIELNSTLLNQNIFFMQKEEYLYNFLFKLFSKYCKNNSFATKVNLNYDQIILNSKSYIKENINSDITIKDISDYLNISQFHFIKIFKLNTKTTPYKYMLNYKIIKAKELLNKDISLSQIAFTLGFSDQSHFNKVFKNYVSLTPKEYKNSIQKQKEQ